MTQACRKCCAPAYLRFYNSEAGYVKEIAKRIEMAVRAELRMKYARSFYVILQRNYISKDNTEIFHRLTRGTN